MKGEGDAGDGLSRPILIMFMATALTGAGNYLYQLYMGRALGQDAYSQLGALLSLLYIASIPAFTIQNIMAHFVSRFEIAGDQAKSSWLVRRVLRDAVALAAIESALLLALSWYLVSFLSITSEGLILITSIALFLTLVIPVGTGTLQGLQRFKAFAANNVAQSLVKLVLGVLLVMAGYGVGGALAAVAVAGVVALAMAFWPIMGRMRSERKSEGGIELWRFALPSTVAVLCFTFMTNIDTFVSRHFLGGFEAGLYLAASTLGKIVLLLPGAVIVVMLPKLSSAKHDPSKAHRLFRRLLMITVLAAASIAAVFCLVPGSLLGLFYGESYLGAVDALRVLSIAMVCFSAVNAFFIYGLSMGRSSYIVVLAGMALAEVAVIELLHGTPADLAWSMLISGLVTAVLCSAIYLLEVRAGRAAMRSPQGGS